MAFSLCYSTVQVKSDRKQDEVDGGPRVRSEPRPNVRTDSASVEQVSQVYVVGKTVIFSVSEHVMLKEVFLLMEQNLEDVVSLQLNAAEAASVYFCSDIKNVKD